MKPTKSIRRLRAALIIASNMLIGGLPAFGAEVVPGSVPLTWEGDLAARMVKGIDTYLDRDMEGLQQRRASKWQRDTSSAGAYEKSLAANRTRLQKVLGVVDDRAPARLEILGAPVGSTNRMWNRTELATDGSLKIYRVRWDVFRGVHGEGLLIEPENPVANVVAVPDADISPEALASLEPGKSELAFGTRLAENGCRVLIPCLVDRTDRFAGLPGVRTIRQTHREVLWRAAYQMGRTIAGYETAKVLAAVDWFAKEGNGLPIGVIGYGEGGMLALFAGALDSRIKATGVSGYFQPREQLYTEPIYRNIWGFLEEFGDAELAAMILPRPLVIEAGRYPLAEYPTSGGAAPGKLVQPAVSQVQTEVDRAKALVPSFAANVDLVSTSQDSVCSSPALAAFLQKLGVTIRPSQTRNPDRLHAVDSDGRMRRQYLEILEDTQHLMREGEFTRAKFWEKADRKSLASFVETAKPHREYFWEEIIGKLPKATTSANPRTRLILETNAFKSYEVVLDVYPDVFAYGILLVPNDIKPGEKRPVVVCQHGLEGRPRDVADPRIDNPAYHMYACRLAERGFVTFSPQNPYIGQNQFRQVLRKAQPLKKSLYGFIVRQHEVILDWLAGLDFVDPKRLAFYGLSYGGKTAMRIPPLLDRYCLSICSADYNEWIWKNVSIRHGYCYLNGGEYDMPEFNLGNTFNYAEMSWLILPRPFMVERGHDDGVAPSEWVAYEFAKTRRMYDKLGLPDKSAIEFFNGPHTIHGKGTFEFLAQHLDWPRGAK